MLIKNALVSLVASASFVIALPGGTSGYATPPKGTPKFSLSWGYPGPSPPASSSTAPSSPASGPSSSVVSPSGPVPSLSAPGPSYPVVSPPVPSYSPAPSSPAPGSSYPVVSPPGSSSLASSSPAPSQPAPYSSSPYYPRSSSSAPPPVETVCTPSKKRRLPYEATNIDRVLVYYTRTSVGEKPTTYFTTRTIVIPVTTVNDEPSTVTSAYPYNSTGYATTVSRNGSIKHARPDFAPDRPRCDHSFSDKDIHFSLRHHDHCYQHRGRE
jgi:hypothetical protein